MTSASKVFGLCAVAVVLYLASLAYVANGSSDLPRLLIEDNFDRNIYYERARFWPERSLPYRDVFSEYPTLGTLSFVAPFVLGDAGTLTEERYRFLWSCWMALTFLAAVALIVRARQVRGLSPAPVLLMLSPSILYFSLMRFDILCAFFVCASLYCFLKGRYSAAYGLLAIGVYVKWYPAVLFPLYLAHNLRSVPRPKTARYAGAFVGVIVLVTVLSIAFFTWDGFLQPYRFHATRGGQYFNLFWLGENAFDDKRLGLFFFAVQLLAPLAFMFMIKPQDNGRSVLKYSVLTIYIFITFAKVDSPQWILWYAPVVLMFACERLTLAALFGTSILNYVVFPLAYKTMDDQGLAFSSIVLIKDISLLTLVFCVLRNE